MSHIKLVVNARGDYNVEGELPYYVFYDASNVFLVEEGTMN